MEEIIIYKEGESLKDKFSSLRFSYQRKYKLYFAQNFNQLGFLLKKGNASLIFYFKEFLEQQDRIRVKNMILNNSKLKICLCSSSEFALDAWKLDVFHFTEYPVISDALISVYKKYVVANGGSDRELTLKEDGEVIKIPYDYINYLHAAGNYTMINKKRDKSHIQTKQLGTFESLTENDLNFIRVHRSLIINIKNVKSIGNKQVIFYQSEKPLMVSGSLQAKLKKLLLGS